MKPRVLWIEDSARMELRNLVGPVYFSGKYDFNLAEDVSAAVSLLGGAPFDAIIVDVRLPPGIDMTWRKHYQKTGSDKIQAQLGMRLLYWLLRGDPAIHPNRPPAWIKPSQVCIFTVESRQEVQPIMDELGISLFQQKMAGLPDTILLELIDEILRQSKPKA